MSPNPYAEAARERKATALEVIARTADLSSADLTSPEVRRRVHAAAAAAHRAAYKRDTAELPPAARPKFRALNPPSADTWDLVTARLRASEALTEQIRAQRT